MNEWKLKVYEPEIDLIKDEKTRKLAEYIITEVLPESSFYIEPSSTRKYHPTCTHKDGGLVIHTKRLIFIARHLARAYNGKLAKEENKVTVAKIEKLADLYIVAGICHDMEKKMVYSKETDKTSHAALAVDKLVEHEDIILDYISRDDLHLICDYIQNHMGPFEEEGKSIGLFTHEELMFYFADYLASRDLLDLPVDNFNLELPYDDKYKKEWSYGAK